VTNVTGFIPADIVHIPTPLKASPVANQTSAGQVIILQNPNLNIE
jgi:hypothetical protein